eukprot:scaffold2043_cov63-Phaeocystis_antarctica.AAC.3
MSKRAWSMVDSYGAECDVVMNTSTPAFRHRAKVSSKASMSSSPPSIASTSKQIPLKPASLTFWISSLPMDAISTVQGGAFAPPPSETNWFPWYLPLFRENGGGKSFLSAGVIKHALQASYDFIVAIRASFLDWPPATLKSIMLSQ